LEADKQGAILEADKQGAILEEDKGLIKGGQNNEFGHLKTRQLNDIK
jgi:hypothetical protein